MKALKIPQSSKTTLPTESQQILHKFPQSECVPLKEKKATEGNTVRVSASYKLNR